MPVKTAPQHVRARMPLLSIASAVVGDSLLSEVRWYLEMDPLRELLLAEFHTLDGDCMEFSAEAALAKMGCLISCVQGLRRFRYPTAINAAIVSGRRPQLPTAVAPQYVRFAVPLGSCRGGLLLLLLNTETVNVNIVLQP